MEAVESRGMPEGAQCRLETRAKVEAWLNKLAEITVQDEDHSSGHCAAGESRADGERKTLSDPETERATSTPTSASSRRWRLANVGARQATLAEMANHRFCPFLAESGHGGCSRGSEAGSSGAHPERKLIRAQHAATFHPRMVGRGHAAGAGLKSPARAVHPASKPAWQEDERRRKMRLWLLKSGLLPQGAAEDKEDMLADSNASAANPSTAAGTSPGRGNERVKGSTKPRGKREMLLHTLWGTETELGSSLFFPASTVKPARPFPEARVPCDPLPVWSY